jgi:hypothetical protein
MLFEAPEVLQKKQIANFKSQINLNFQTPKSCYCDFIFLNFGICLCFWRLRFGISYCIDTYPFRVIVIHDSPEQSIPVRRNRRLDLVYGPFGIQDLSPLSPARPALILRNGGFDPNATPAHPVSE